MREWLYRHRFGLTVGLLLLLPLVLMYFHGRRATGSFVERFSTGVAGLAQSGVTSVVEGVSGLLDQYVFLVGVEEENRKVHEENDRLVGAALEAKRLAIKNQELRRQLGLRTRRRDLVLAPATVVGREPTPYYRVSRMTVETDGNRGPEVDMAVVTPAGLVGRIVHVSGRFADVMLLADSRSRVACEVLGKGILGMLFGSGRPDAYQARLQVSITEPDLEVGAVVVTSGHDRVFPRSLEVGYVADYVKEPEHRRQAGAFVEYDVALAVNPAAVDEAMVVLEAGAGAGGGRP